ncbi:MAG: hypothetical protein K6T72_17005, partial [Anoxybacillus sp.]
GVMRSVPSFGGALIGFIELTHAEPSRAWFGSLLGGLVRSSPIGGRFARFLIKINFFQKITICMYRFSSFCSEWLLR